MLWYKIVDGNPLAGSARPGVTDRLHRRHGARLSPNNQAPAAAAQARSEWRDGPADRGVDGVVARLPRLCMVAVVPEEHAPNVGALCGASRNRRPALARLWTRSLVHAVPASLAQSFAWSSGRDWAGGIAAARLCSLSAPAGALAGSRANLWPRRRADPQRVPVHRGGRVLQPGVSGQQRLQRPVAADTDRPLRGDGASVLRTGPSRPAALQPVPGHERGDVLPWWRRAGAT